MADRRMFGTTLAVTECSRAPMVCPKPRRISVINHVAAGDSPFLPFRRHLIDSEAGSELLDIIFAQGTRGSDRSVSASPPYFCGSPPIRTANPLVHDAMFAERRADMIPMVPGSLSQSVVGSGSFPSTAISTPHQAASRAPPSSCSGSSASARKGCARDSFDHKPVAVRIEGFDCLDLDSRGCSIPAIA